MDGLRRWIKESHAPVVLVSSTEGAKRLCLKNGLSTADMLSAFCIADGEVPVRTIARHYSLRDFRVRFLDASEMLEVPLEVAEERLADVVRSHAPEQPHVQPQLRGRQGVSDLIMQLNHNEPTPWYQDFRRDLARSLQLVEFEMLHMPAVLLFVVSSLDPEPLRCFDELASAHYLPQGFGRGQFNAGAVDKQYVLLHDNCEAAGVDALALLRQMKATLPATACRLLCINTLPQESQHLQQPDIWSPQLRPPFFSPPAKELRPEGSAPVTGSFLAAEDLMAIQSFCSELTTAGVLPALERRIFNLNASVSAVRKGVKNVLKSWLRKPREQADAVAGEVAYRYTTIESQIRLLADSAFLLQDYELALSNYRLVREDFKSDKALLHYGCVNDMIAMCLLMLDGSRRDTEAALESAAVAFARVAEEDRRRNQGQLSVAARLHTRTALLASDLLRATPGGARMRDAAQLLMRASVYESHLCSAVLIEQAALCRLYSAPSLFRKYGFHLVIAGNQYHSSEQLRHAVRCYAAAMGLYEGRRWTAIQDHMHFTLARQLYTLGDPGAALRFFLKLAAAGRHSPDRQTQFLRESLFILRKQQEEQAGGADAEGPVADDQRLEVTELALPHVIDASVTVSVRDNAWEAAPEAPPAERAAAFSELREDMVADLRATDGPEAVVAAARTKAQRQAGWMRGSKRKGREIAAVQKRVVGEPVFVDVDLRNPLAVPLELMRVQLRASLVPEGAEAEDGFATDGAHPRLPDQPAALPQAPAGSAAPMGLAQRLVAQGEASAQLRRFSASAPPSIVTSQSRLFAQPAAGASSAETRAAFDGGDAAPEHPDRGLEVDEQALTLAPASTQRIRLRVRPLRTGTLHIYAVRWLLYGDVWGVHEFSLPGKPVHDTLAERAERRRCPDKRLEVAVVQAQPWLGARVDGKPESLLQGQQHRLTLRLRNFGREELHDIVLKSSALGVCVGHAQDVDAPVGMAAATHPLASASGVTGTTVRLPVPPLLPGQEVALPVWYHAEGSGLQTVRWLLSYKPTAEAEGHGPPREVQLEFSFYVLPSLNVTATVRPSESIAGEYVLSLQASNLRSDSDSGQRALAVRQVSAVSGAWTLRPLAVDAAATELQWQESSVLHFVVSRARPEALRPDSGLCHTDLSLHGEGAPPQDSTAAPGLQLLCQAHAGALLEEELREQEAEQAAREAGGSMPNTISSIRRQNQGDEGGNGGEADGTDTLLVAATDPAALAQKGTELNLVVAWEAATPPPGGGPVCSGQHFLRQLVVRNKVLPRTCPLHASVRYTADVEYDFSQVAPCRVPVRLDICNGSWPTSAPLAFTVEVLRPAEIMKANGPMPLLQPAYSWVGQTRRRVDCLRPGETLSLQLEASFVRPGVYDLNRFACLLDGLRFMFPVQFFVSVKASTSASGAASVVSPLRKRTLSHGYSQSDLSSPAPLDSSAAPVAVELDLGAPSLSSEAAPVPVPVPASVAPSSSLEAVPVPVPVPVPVAVPAPAPVPAPIPVPASALGEEALEEKQPEEEQEKEAIDLNEEAPPVVVEEEPPLVLPPGSPRSSLMGLEPEEPDSSDSESDEEEAAVAANVEAGAEADAGADAEAGADAV